MLPVHGTLWLLLTRLCLSTGSVTRVLNKLCVLLLLLHLWLLHLLVL